MLSNSFKTNESDKCVCTGKNKQTQHAIICSYVDDVLILGSNTNIIKIIKQMLTNKFDMKDIGDFKNDKF